MPPMPTPTPTPILVQMVGTGENAPWWGVPTIAGAFLIIGGYLTYLYARHTERTKADRAQQEKWEEDLLTSGLAMLAVGAELRNFGLLTLRRVPSESIKLAAARGTPLAEKFTSAARRFSITMPPEFQADFNGYVGASVMLLVPPFQRPGQELVLNKQTKHERELVTQLRAMRKLKPLSFPGEADFGSITGEEVLAQGLASDMEAERGMKRERGNASDEPAPAAD